MDIVHTTSRICDTPSHAVYPRKNGRKAVNDADLRSLKKGAQRFTGTQGHPGQGCRHAWPVRDMSPRHHKAGTSGLCCRICPPGAEQGRADATEGTMLTGGHTHTQGVRYLGHTPPRVLWTHQYSITTPLAQSHRNQVIYVTGKLSMWT